MVPESSWTFALSDSSSFFILSIRGNLTLFTDQDPEVAFPSQDVVWDRFEQAFRAVWGLVTYAPVFRDYYYQGLTQFYMDNVMYLEVRALLPEVQSCMPLLCMLSSLWLTQMPCRSLRRKASRFLTFSMLERRVSSSGRLLVVSEDALLLNTSRIGHGFALVRHPLAKDLSRKKGVAVEVCPISNQVQRVLLGLGLVLLMVLLRITQNPLKLNVVLKLVKDLRNHPAAALMLESHPVVISSDDPAMFGASGLSYDFYEAFVGFGGMKSHIGSLKQLAINSIR
ncbi:hypothetical protein XENOCAPTIV_010209 [Xenoophorus captivus]|uniref:Uncharacterized protein n=1 Tax=Xenoophorus captivus TaxID=1517983 RepID=A0ABV0RM43_9TELE